MKAKEKGQKEDSEERFARRSLVERAIMWLKKGLMGSLLLRSEDLGYLGGLINLIYFLKLQNSPATVNLATLL